MGPGPSRRANPNPTNKRDCLGFGVCLGVCLGFCPLFHVSGSLENGQRRIKTPLYWAFPKTGVKMAAGFNPTKVSQLRFKTPIKPHLLPLQKPVWALFRSLLYSLKQGWHYRQASRYPHWFGRSGQQQAAGSIRPYRPHPGSLKDRGLGFTGGRKKSLKTKPRNARGGPLPALYKTGRWIALAFRRGGLAGNCRGGVASRCTRFWPFWRR